MEFTNDSFGKTFSVRFQDINTDNNRPAHALTDVYISADADPSRPDPVVWIDTYGSKVDDRTQTTYGHINADQAEAIGVALIMAARIARGELKLDDL